MIGGGLYILWPEIKQTGRWWKRLLNGQITSEDFVMGEEWGGTPHLEDDSAAHGKWLERLSAFANTSGVYSTWSAADLTAARNFAQYAFPQSGGNAPIYWAMIADWWSTEAPSQLTSLDVEQFQKISDLLQVSKDASATYKRNREKGFDPEAKDVPWWVWAIGAFSLWNFTRR
jgi:hypothetical protein